MESSSDLAAEAERRYVRSRVLTVTVWASYGLALLAIVWWLSVIAVLGGMIYGDLAYRSEPSASWDGYGRWLLVEGLKPLFAFVVVPLLLLKIVLVGYFAFFVAPSLVTLPVTLPFALGWRTPRRILVFRPFHHGAASDGMKRVIREQLAPFGHVYTLSDPHIRVSGWTRITMLLGNLTWLMFSQQRIKRLRDLDRLEKLLACRVRRNLNWVLGSSRVFPITSSDAVWRECVERLVGLVDAIVVDVTDLGTNVEWELEICRRQAMLARVLFVVSADEEAAARRFLDEKVAVTAPLFAYNAGREVPRQLCMGLADVLVARPASADPT